MRYRFLEPSPEKDFPPSSIKTRIVSCRDGKGAAWEPAEAARVPSGLVSLLCREIVLLSPGFFPHAHNLVGSFTPAFPSAAVGFHAVGTLPGVALALTRAASPMGPSENVEETVTFLLGSLWKSVRIEMGWPGPAGSFGAVGEADAEAGRAMKVVIY